MDKFKIPVLIALIVLALSLSAGAFVLFQKEHAKNLSLQEELTDVKAKYKVAEAKLQENRKALVALENKLKETTAQVDALSGELEKEKAVKQEALTQVEQVKADLEQQKKLRSDLENLLNQTQEDTRKAQGQLKALEAKRKELETKIKELQAQTQGVELGKIVVGQPEKAAGQEVSGVVPSTPAAVASEAATKALEGRILVVNKEYNFAVINLGSKDGVVLEDTFAVYHNDKYIGDVKVEKVHDAMSAVGFVSSEMKDLVSEEDKVVQKV